MCHDCCQLVRRNSYHYLPAGFVETLRPRALYCHEYSVPVGVPVSFANSGTLMFCGGSIVTELKVDLIILLADLQPLDFSELQGKKREA